MARSALIFLAAFFFGISLCQSQSINFNYHNFGIEDGLQSINVFNVQQGKDRLIYITTENGLFVFNGLSFIPVKSDTTINPTVIGAHIIDKSTVYLATREQGIIKVNPNTGEFEDILKDDNNLTCDKVLIEGNYAYLLTSQVKLDIVDLKEKRIINDPIISKNKSNQALCFYKTKDGQLLCGRNDGLYEVNASKITKLGKYP
ncbi:MAG: hypothetical protein AB7O73_02655, partial [Bacteroidia bacterium]